MERSEPALIPEWLRGAGSVTGAGSSAHHPASSSTHSDASSAAQHTRNRSSKSTIDFDSPRSAFLERSSSSNSRRSSVNGSTKHAYSNFNRNHRDKDRDREKERLNFGDHWDRDSSDPLINLFSGRVERDTLRRSNSMVSRKQSELLPRRVAVDTKTGGNSNHSNGNGLLSGASIGSSIQKAVFDKDFPSLGSEEKQGISEMGRVSSPVLAATSSQSLPVGSSALIGGEGWTSALAEVPTVIGSNSTGSLTMQQPASTTSGPAALSTTAGLNMAEALAQAPSRARSAPQVSVKTQRLEELAIKQSRQLIPVTPSMPKASVLTSEKLKPKTAVRTPELNVAGKSGSQQPSSLNISNLSFRGGNSKSDAPKTSGKFTDLKSVVWENGLSPTSKDASSPTNFSNIKSGNNLSAASAATSTPLRNPNNLKSSTDRKPASVDPKLGSTMDKKPSLSQVQSRNDFFNLIKKKTLMNSSTGNTDSAPIHSSPTMEKSAELAGEVSPPACPQPLGNVAEVTINGDAPEGTHRFPDTEEKDFVQSDTVYPDEEEAAFLRSLGWEENSGEDEGLTEEEINAFYQEFMKLGPATTFKLCQGMQPKLSKLFEPHATNLCGASAESSSSDSESDA
ncbi:mediator of RNA polymerase II transcription subunit 1 [Neltuma alba]|uniref:mediator of RNA polymerase II transcription subunit 1 n=1 Tax=Neltuma alba TaxID=207710 RepID=UPI0010A54E1C|nr:mediator of RNA polymerase II transcription subunit 1-like [Prosopis alba]XP_028775041.1 mediator of RNA polymerase II transcription subunit 1-like [Prosopis alba]